MEARNIAEALMELVDDEGDDREFGHECFHEAVTHGYEELGILTTDAGFVVRVADGSEFQVTVVKSH